MYRTLEAIFRKPLQLLILIVLLPALGVAIAYVLPRSYQSTAALWALHRYIVIGATGPESDLQSTPAQTQATALIELLQTRTFVLPIAHETNLASTLNLSSSVLANPEQLDDALFNEISQKVVVASQGYNLFEVSYTNPDPQVAQQVVKGVIKSYASLSIAFSNAEAHLLLASYQAQLATAQQNVDAAVTAETRYAAAHPANRLANDPQYALLDAQRLQAQAIVQSIQGEITTVNQAISTQGTSADSLFQVIDAPALPDRAVSRLRLYLTSGGIGLGVAMLAYVLYIAILVRRNRAIYTPLDLEKVVSVPVVMQLPHLSAQTVPLLIEPPLRRSA
jgi:hypothetical protein